jgi:hypothetical protein
MNMEHANNIKIINGVDIYTKLGGKPRIKVEGSQIPNLRTYVVRVALQ